MIQFALDETEHTVGIRKWFPIKKKVRIANQTLPVLVMHITADFYYNSEEDPKLVQIALPMVSLAEKQATATCKLCANSQSRC